MKNEAQHIPAEVFDWLEKNSFTSLSEKQQAEVLLYFSFEEYEELHQSVRGLLPVHPVVDEGGRIARKQELLNRFDEKYNKPSPVLMFINRPVTLWKAAAVFFLFAGGWMSHYLLNSKKQPVQPEFAAADTVYISRQNSILPVMIYDTIFIREETASRLRNKTYNNNKREETKYSQGVQLNSGELNVLSVNDLDSMPNIQKRNSIKDDELIRKYQFTTFM